VKRTFIAFDIIPSPETKAFYEQIRHKLRLEKINWIEDAGFHMTLKFLGDTPEESIPGITESLRIVSDHYAPFNISLNGLGLFKSLREPRVIWIGCDFDPVLGKIRKEIDDTLETFGFPSDQRRFTPHLTLGRIKQIRQVNQLAEIIAAYQEVHFQQQQVKEIIFYESQLSPSGARYMPLYTFHLK
jgi:2'-5' RNA ligase